MVILLKHTLKNIIKKPLRSLILVFCMTVTCFTAYMMLDMTGALESVILNYAADMLGNCDVEVGSSRNIPAEVFDGFPENVALAIHGSGYKIATRDPEQYSYEFMKDMNILGVDLDKAFQMGIFNEPVELTDQEAAISVTYAGDFGWKTGDKISLYDEKGGLHEYTVKYILPEAGVFLQKGQYTALVNLEAIKVLQGKKELKSTTYLIDVKNDKEINAFCQKLEEEYPTYQYSRIKGDEQVREMISQITIIFVVLFSVTFLMVIFVTVGLSERIVCERMAVIGTFKSLGISDRATTFILLLENISYGLAGAIFGSLLYGAIRGPMLESMMVMQEGVFVRYNSLQGWIHLVVFLGAVLIQCICPVFELTKAVKTAIRDIIFSNKDTKYRVSRKKTAAGFCLSAAGAVLAAVCLKTNGFAVIAGMVLVVVGLSFVVPLILKGVSGLLVRLFERLRMPTASLAAREIGTKKTTVANGVLCVTVSSLAIAVFALAGGLMKQFSADAYDADVLAMGIGEKAEYYSYVKDLPGVTQVQFLYDTIEELDFSEKTGKKTICDIMALPKGDLFCGIDNLPQIGNDEFLMSDTQAQKLGISAGDTVKITFKGTYLFPITKELRLAGVVNTSRYQTSPMVLLTQDTYIDIYHNMVSTILIKCENPDETKALLEKYALNRDAQFYTREEFRRKNEEDNAGLLGILYGIIALGILLTLIGISGNQVVGFEGRRREYAVMHSTSMTKGQIGRLIFLETAFSMGIGIGIAIFIGRLINFLLEKAVFAIGLPLELGGTMSDNVRMGAILMAVLLFTCITPLRALCKMNTAQELKYE